MQLSLKIFVAFLLSLLIVNCSLFSSSESEGLQSGKFKAEVTGAIENKFSGDASYSLSKIEAYRQKFLFLSLKVDDVPYTPDDINTSTGIFLAIPWDSANTLLSIDNSPITNTYVDPDNYRKIYLDSGIIEITERSKDKVAGSFNLQATTDQKEIEIKGEFKANKSK